MEIARHVPGNASGWLHKEPVQRAKCGWQTSLKGLIPHTQALRFYLVNKEELLNSCELE